MEQQIIVDIIVGCAISYAAWRLMPAALRRWLARKLGSTGQQLGLSATHAQQLTSKLESSGGCGSCDSCNACATPAEKAGQPLHLQK